VSQPSQAAAFSYPNQRPIRPPLSREHRNRVFVAGEDASEIGVVLGVSIVVTVVGFLVYAAVGSLVWWWMAHALRRVA
jgi:hypothetical protein